MKTKYISYIGSFAVLILLFLVFHKRLHCQSNPPLSSSGSSAQVSPGLPDTFPGDGPQYSTLWHKPEYIVLDQVPDFQEPFINADPVITKDDIFLPIHTNPITVLQFTRNGALTQKLEFDLDPESALDIQILPEQQVILVGDNLQQSIQIFDLEGRFRETLHVGFHFQQFHASPSLSHFIFYLAHDGSSASRHTSIPAIRITDHHFNTLFTYFPMSDRAISAPFFHATRVKKHAAGIYYNPDYTDQIFDVRFDGHIALLYDGAADDPDLEQTLDSIVYRTPIQKQVGLLTKIMPIEYFWITPDHIIIASVPGMTNHDLIIDRRTQQSTLISGGTLMTNFGPAFHFGYMRPQFAMRDQFAVLMDARNYNFYLDHLPEEPIRHLPKRLAPNQSVMMLYTPNPDVFFPPGTTPSSALPDPVLELLPNPAKDQVNIVWTGITDNLIFRVFSPDGTMRFDEQVSSARDRQTWEINTSQWTPGPYIVQVQSTESVLARTLIIQ